MQGLFEIEKVVFLNAVMLKLPRCWRLHNVFHIWSLEPYHVSSKASCASSDPERVRNEADEMDIDVEEGQWEIDEIIGSSYYQDGNLKYLTNWVGFPQKENWTEEPLKHFLGSGEGMIRAFHSKHPYVAKDLRVRLQG